MLWTEQNSRTFEDKVHSMDVIKGAFVSSLFNWARVWGFTTTTLVTDFVLSLSYLCSSSYLL